MKKTDEGYYELTSQIINTGSYNGFVFIKPDYNTLSKDKVNLICPICKSKYCETKIDEILQGTRDRCPSCQKIATVSKQVAKGLVYINSNNVPFEILNDVNEGSSSTLEVRNINVNTKLTVSLEDYESELNKVLVGSEKINPQGVPYMVVGIKEETGRYNVLFKDGTNVLTIGKYITLNRVSHPGIKDGKGEICGYILFGEAFKMGCHVFYYCEKDGVASIKSMDSIVGSDYEVLSKGVEFLGSYTDSYYKLRCPQCGVLLRYKSVKYDNGKLRKEYKGCIKTSGCKRCGGVALNERRDVKHERSGEIVYNRDGESAKIVESLGKGFILLEFEDGLRCRLHKSMVNEGRFVKPLVTYSTGDLYVDAYGVEYSLVVDKDYDAIELTCIKTGKVISGLYTIKLNNARDLDFSKKVMEGYTFSLSDGRVVKISNIKSPYVFDIDVSGVSFEFNTHENYKLVDFINSDPILSIDKRITKVNNLSFWSKEGYRVKVVGRGSGRYVYMLNIFGSIVDLEIPSFKQVIQGQQFLYWNVSPKGLSREFMGWTLYTIVKSNGGKDVWWSCKEPNSDKYHCLRPIDIVEIENGVCSISDRDKLFEYKGKGNITRSMTGVCYTSADGIDYITIGGNKNWVEILLRDGST